MHTKEPYVFLFVVRLNGLTVGSTKFARPSNYKYATLTKQYRIILSGREEHYKIRGANVVWNNIEFRGIRIHKSKKMHFLKFETSNACPKLMLLLNTPDNVWCMYRLSINYLTKYQKGKSWKRHIFYKKCWNVHTTQTITPPNVIISILYTMYPVLVIKRYLV